LINILNSRIVVPKIRIETIKKIIKENEIDRKMMLNYDAPLYRPPSEARSLIFQVTLRLFI